MSHVFDGPLRYGASVVKRAADIIVSATVVLLGRRALKKAHMRRFVVEEAGHGLQLTMLLEHVHTALAYLVLALGERRGALPEGCRVYALGAVAET